MAIEKMIYKLRTDAKLSQEQFAELFGVSRQAVQKWESGDSVPDLDKIIRIAKYFDVMIDILVLESDRRIAEELNYYKEIKPCYENIHKWESYSSELITEYTQSMEEGLDVEQYQDLFEAVSRLPKNEIKKKLGDVLYEIVSSARLREGYPYV